MKKYQPQSNCISKCDIVHKCANNKCMFRLRDVFGHPVFGAPGYQLAIDRCNNAYKLAGLTKEEIQQTGWPTMTGRPGTNCVYLYCDWYIEPEE